MERKTLNCRSKIMDISEPLVMGILNLTPDSFFDGGKFIGEQNILSQVEKMLSEGAAIIDIGGMSTRPGAEMIPEEEELKRILSAIKSIINKFPEAVLSIDTFRSGVAEKAVQNGASIINDVSGGNIDPEIYKIAVQYDTPYICMHMKGSPQTMQRNPEYEHVTTEILDFFIQKVTQIKNAGVKDIILDPGFGFGKNLEQNFQLLKELETFNMLGYPILVGISRKSMVCQALKVNPENALNGTIALNMAALMNGAKILRVHDVKEAVEVVTLYKLLQGK